MKIRRNHAVAITQIAYGIPATQSVTPALRSGSPLTEHSSFAALAADHSLFAAFSGARAGGSSSHSEGISTTVVLLIVGLGVACVLCAAALLVYAGTRADPAEGKKQRDDDDSTSSEGTPSRGSPRSDSRTPRESPGGAGRTMSGQTGKAARKGRTQLFGVQQRTQDRQHKAHVEGEEGEEDTESEVGLLSGRSERVTSGRKPEGLFAECIHELGKQELEENMGVSGMCLASNLEDMRTVVLIAVQAFCLQAMILYFIAGTLTPHPHNAEKALPVILMDAAIYLHFVSCVRDLPQSLLLLRRFHTYHKTKIETMVFGAIFIADALIVPLVQLIVGALFLCTSMTVADVIMNSCAVAYISSIDNMILEVHRSLLDLTSMKRDHGDEKVEISVPENLINLINWTVCVVPVIPCLFSCVMAYVGLELLKL